MTTNKDLLHKADVALSDLASGGLLNAEQSDTFLRKLITQPTLLKQARVVTMNAPQRKIEKIGFGVRLLHEAVSSTASTSGQRKKPTFETITLSTKENMATVKIPYDVMEDNIERSNLGLNSNEIGGGAVTGGIRDTILDLMVEQVAVDLEELAILGDTGSGDSFLAQNDGFIKIAETSGNTVDISGAAIAKETFKAGKKAMPDEHLRNIASMRHYISMDQHTEYVDTLANRPTGLGDASITGTSPVWAFGTPVEAVSLIPEAKGLFTNPKNLLMGIQRDISMEFDKDIEARVYTIVITLRMDFKIEEPEAVVVYNNIG